MGHYAVFRQLTHILTFSNISLKTIPNYLDSAYFCGMKIKEMKRPALPAANLDLLERLYKHGIIWMVLFIIFFAVHPNGNYFFRAVSSLCFVGIVILLVLFINKVLIDLLLKEKRMVLFILFSILSIPVWALVSTIVDVFLIRFFDGKPPREILVFPTTLVVYMVRLIWFIAIYAVTVIFYYQRRENEEKFIADQLKSEKLDMELRYLKSQINPHFLFNALNNIYSMVYTHDDNAADGVLKLSEMLRYVLVDCQAEMIPLSKEITYVENFIDFQMMRIGGYRDVHFEKDVEKEDFMIAPMLLQPIIENCFKYSRLETHPDGYVHVKVQQAGNKFRFEAENTVAENAKTLMLTERKSGIGQTNVRQRLMLHYEENYVFEIEQDKGIYKVRIEL